MEKLGCLKVRRDTGEILEILTKTRTDNVCMCDSDKQLEDILTELTQGVEEAKKKQTVSVKQMDGLPALSIIEPDGTETVTPLGEKQVQADLSTNDASDPSFVKNRTHWVDADGTVHQLDPMFIPEGTGITHEWNGTTLTVTSASGTTSADLKGDSGANGKSAYEYAQLGGYTGTEEEFAELLAKDFTLADLGITASAEELNFVDGVTSKIQSQLNGKLGKTTYEYNTELALGSSGKVCIGKFPMYDSNVTVEIKSTTNKTFNGTLVLATQNINTTGGGSYSAKVYGDADNSLTEAIKIRYVSGSNEFSVYIDLPVWSKNLLHIQCVALNGTPTDIATSVSEIPSDATILPVNALKSSFAHITHTHDLSDVGLSTDADNNLYVNGKQVGGASSWNDLTDKPFYVELDGCEILPETEAVYYEEDGAILFLVDANISFIENVRYVVTWNGVEYEVIGATSEGTVYLGNVGILDGSEPTDEPFVMIADAEELIILPLDGSTELTLSIYQEEVVSKLDNKYLDLEWLPATIETNDLYYEKEVTMEHSFDAGNGYYYHEISGLISGYDFYGGEIVIVYYDKQKFELPVVSCTDANYNGVTVDKYIGNPNIIYSRLDDTGQDFCIALRDGGGADITSKTDGKHSYSIYKTGHKTNKMPDKFLPETPAFNLSDFGIDIRTDQEAEGSADATALYYALQKGVVKLDYGVNVLNDDNTYAPDSFVTFSFGQDLGGGVMVVNNIHWIQTSKYLVLVTIEVSYDGTIRARATVLK